jgi:hypothetical protein
VLWDTPVILVLGKLRLEDYKLKASLGCIDLVSKKKKRKERRKEELVIESMVL